MIGLYSNSSSCGADRISSLLGIDSCQCRPDRVALNVDPLMNWILCSFLQQRSPIANESLLSRTLRTIISHRLISRSYLRLQNFSDSAVRIPEDNPPCYTGQSRRNSVKKVSQISWACVSKLCLLLPACQSWRAVAKLHPFPGARLLALEVVSNHDCIPRSLVVFLMRPNAYNDSPWFEANEFVSSDEYRDSVSLSQHLVLESLSWLRRLEYESSLLLWASIYTEPRSAWRCQLYLYCLLNSIRI